MLFRRVAFLLIAASPLACGDRPTEPDLEPAPSVPLSDDPVGPAVAIEPGASHDWKFSTDQPIEARFVLDVESSAPGGLKVELLTGRAILQDTTFLLLRRTFNLLPHLALEAGREYRLRVTAAPANGAPFPVRPRVVADLPSPPEVESEKLLILDGSKASAFIDVPPTDGAVLLRLRPVTGSEANVRVWVGDQPEPDNEIETHMSGLPNGDRILRIEEAGRFRRIRVGLEPREIPFTINRFSLWPYSTLPEALGGDLLPSAESQIELIDSYADVDDFSVPGEGFRIYLRRSGSGDSVRVVRSPTEWPIAVVDQRLMYGGSRLTRDSDSIRVEGVAGAGVEIRIVEVSPGLEWSSVSTLTPGDSIVEGWDVGESDRFQISSPGSRLVLRLDEGGARLRLTPLGNGDWDVFQEGGAIRSGPYVAFPMATSPMSEGDTSVVPFGVERGDPLPYWDIDEFRIRLTSESQMVEALGGYGEVRDEAGTLVVSGHTNVFTRGPGIFHIRIYGSGIIGDPPGIALVRSFAKN